MNVLEIKPDRTAPKGTVAFHAWRGRALMGSSARRELWREALCMETEQLRHEIKLYEYLTSDARCRAVRGDHMFRVDSWYLRMYRTTLRNRLSRGTVAR
jgi:hypothetical protein